MKKVYFAHPINTYGTALEAELLALVKTKWPHHEVVNPSDAVHEAMAKELRTLGNSADVMAYFESLVASCDELVALPFADSMWGAGIWSEAEIMLAKDGWVWMIHPDSRKVTYVPKLIAERKLSIDDTRARIRNPDGTPKPYA
jgi:hypothetical protein